MGYPNGRFITKVVHVYMYVAVCVHTAGDEFDLTTLESQSHIGSYFLECLIDGDSQLSEGLERSKGTLLNF